METNSNWNENNRSRNLKRDDEEYPDNESYQDKSDESDDYGAEPAAENFTSSIRSTSGRGNKAKGFIADQFAKLFSQKFRRLSGGAEGNCDFCMLCGKTLTLYGNKSNNDTSRNHLRRHLILTHPETLFEPDRLPKLTLEQFTICCKHALNRLLIQGKQNSGRQGFFRCPFCNKNVRSSPYFQQHVVRMHSESVRAEIANVQTSTDPKEILSLSIPRTMPNFTVSKCKIWHQFSKLCKTFYVTTTARKVKKCKLCNENVLERSLSTHLIQYHPETLFENYKPSEWSTEKFQDNCKKLLQLEMTRGKQVKTYKCCFCPAKRPSGESFRYHLASNHLQNLWEKLVNLMGGKSSKNLIAVEAQIEEMNDEGIVSTPTVSRNPKLRSQVPKTIQISKVTVQAEGNKSKAKPKKKTSSQTLATDLVVRLREKLFGVISFSDIHRCKICNESFKNRSFAKIHMIDTHADKLFVDMQLKNVTAENFQYCCDQLLKIEVKRSPRFYEGKPPGKKKCLYCGEFIVGYHHLRYHFFIKHFEIMEEKLIRLQTQKEWLYKGDMVGIKRRRRLGLVKDKTSPNEMPEIETGTEVKKESGCDDFIDRILSDEAVNVNEGKEYVAEEMDISCFNASDSDVDIKYEIFVPEQG